MSLFKILVLLYQQPLKKRKQNIISIISEMLFLLAHMTLLVFPLLERYLSVTEIKFLSWAAASFFMGSFTLELCMQSSKKKQKGKKG